MRRKIAYCMGSVDSIAVSVVISVLVSAENARGVASEDYIFSTSWHAFVVVRKLGRSQYIKNMGEAERSVRESYFSGPTYSLGAISRDDQYILFRFHIKTFWRSATVLLLLVLSAMRDSTSGSDPLLVLM